MLTRKRCTRKAGIRVTENIEGTPVANVAFKGQVAEELTRVYGQVKELEVEIERLERIVDSLLAANRVLRSDKFKNMDPFQERILKDKADYWQRRATELMNRKGGRDAG